MYKRGAASLSDVRGPMGFRLRSADPASNDTEHATLRASHCDIATSSEKGAFGADRFQGRRVGVVVGKPGIIPAGGFVLAQGRLERGERLSQRRRVGVSCARHLVTRP